jgi:hypothetical protein
MPKLQRETASPWKPRSAAFIVRMLFLTIVAVSVIARVVTAASPDRSAPVPTGPADLLAMLIPSLGPGAVPEATISRQSYDVVDIAGVPSDLLAYELADQGLEGAAVGGWAFPNSDTYQVTLLRYDSADDAKSATQLLAVQSLATKPQDTRRTVGEGEAFFVPAPASTIHIQFGFRDRYVFVVEAVTVGAPEIPLDEVAQQQYALL